MRIAILGLLAAAAFLPAGSAWAAPFEYVDAQSTFIMTDAKITAIKEHWLLDPINTSQALRQFDANKSRALEPDEIDAYMRKRLSDLKAHNYFTSLEADGNVKSLSQSGAIASNLEDNGRISMEFTLTLMDPIDPKLQTIKYRLYDPDYYVALKHGKKDAIHFEGVADGVCTADLQYAKPQSASVRIAKSIGKHSLVAEQFGRQFAETIMIACQ